MPRYRFEDIVYNITEKKKPIPSDKDLYVGLEHLESGTLKIRNYGSDVVINNEKLFMRKCDILFGRRNAYLKRVGIAPHDGLFSAHGMIFRPKSVIEPAFLPFFIASDYFMEQAIKISVGSLSPTVNWGTLKELKFDIPTIEEQQELIKVLLSLEDNQNKTFDALQSAIKMRGSFIDDVYKRIIKVKDEDGQVFPEWKDMKLCQFADKLTRKNTENQTNRPLTISATEGLIDQTEYFNKIVASNDLKKYFLLMKGDFAYNKSYSIGFPVGSIKRLDKYDCGALSSLYICFSLKDGFDSDYIKYYFESTCWYDEISKIVEEGARAHGLLNVSKNAFFETSHTLSTNEVEQKIIAKKILEFDILVSDLNDKLNSIRKLRQSYIDEVICEKED